MSNYEQIPLFPEDSAAFDPIAVGNEVLAAVEARPQPAVDTELSPALAELGYQRAETGPADPTPRKFGRTDQRPVSSRLDVPREVARHQDVQIYNELFQLTGPDKRSPSEVEQQRVIDSRGRAVAEAALKAVLDRLQ
ncbi:MAG: hypothetical protein ABIV43_02635 [Candidatus Saccharimonadales bacterium]